VSFVFKNFKLIFHFSGSVKFLKPWKRSDGYSLKILDIFNQQKLHYNTNFYVTLTKNELLTTGWGKKSPENVPKMKEKKCFFESQKFEFSLARQFLLNVLLQIYSLHFVANFDRKRRLKKQQRTMNKLCWFTRCGLFKWIRINSFPLWTGFQWPILG
jgi:hypothetical protein